MEKKKKEERSVEREYKREPHNSHRKLTSIYQEFNNGQPKKNKGGKKMRTANDVNWLLPL
jgi:hypothetical protein